MGRVLPAGKVWRAATGAVLAVVLCTPPAHAAGPSRRVEQAVGKPYQRLIEKVADRYRLDRSLLAALVEVESARRTDAISAKGARGLGQLMPGTAERFGVLDIHDPEDNLSGAAQYLSWLIARYQGDLRLALAAYNAGEGVVDRTGTVPRYPETLGFVQKVLERSSSRGRARLPDEPDPVRVARDATGRILLTNVD